MNKKGEAKKITWDDVIAMFAENERRTAERRAAEAEKRSRALDKKLDRLEELIGGEKYDYMVPNRIHPDFVKELAEKKIARFRKYFTRYNDCKAYLGVAGSSFCEAVTEEARKYGVRIIKQVGQSIEIEADHLKAY